VSFKVGDMATYGPHFYL